MKNIVLVLIILLSVVKEIKSQAVIGKIIDEYGEGLVDVQLQLYTSSNVYNTTSYSDGTFSFTIITGVEDYQLPTGYSISDNFPNPFNPRTRIAITLPSRGNVKVEVFNLLGQSVAYIIDETFDAGTNYIEIELNGLPNGFYISRINIDNKYTVVKKLMLIYGSQHLIANRGTNNSTINKPNNAYLDIILDSLVATDPIIGKKTFTSLPNYVSGTLDLGNLTMERCPTVLYEGKIYHTVQIGNQCWLKENLDVGTMLTYQNSTDNGIIEKYCYDHDPNNCDAYGGLYQWNEAMQYVNTEGAQGICPPGWHIPTLAEFQTLLAAVNNDGNSLKAIGQGTGDGAGTNTSGFSALLAGYRALLSNTFYGLGGAGLFWSSKDYDGATAYSPGVIWDSSNIRLVPDFKNQGFSIRCVKD